MTKENALMCVALVLIELMNVEQIFMILPILKHVLIYKSEIKQQLLQNTNVLSHIP